MRKLFLRLALVMALFGAMVILPSDLTTEKASGSICCSVCDAYSQECSAACPPLGQPGHFQCIRQCNDCWRTCYGTC